MIDEEREENGKIKMEEYYMKLEEGIQSIQILKCESDVESNAKLTGQKLPLFLIESVYMHMYTRV